MKFLIFGAGHRVQSDVLPILTSLVTHDDISIVRRKSVSVKDYSSIRTYTESDIHTLEYDNFDVIIFCLAPTELRKVLDAIANKLCGIDILVDTPVFLNKVMLRKLDKVCRLRVLEDNGLIPWIQQFRKQIPNKGLFVVYRALYFYHGLAFLGQLFRDRDIFFIRLFPKKFNRIITLMLVKPFLLVIWIHFRNYRKSKLFWWHRKFNSLSSEYFIDKLSFESTFNECRHKAAKVFDYENYDFSSSPLQNMHFWKRAGLFTGLEALIKENINIFPTLDDAIANEKLWKN